MAESTIGPSSVSMGLRPISMGNSLPSFFRPYRSRPAPIGRDTGSSKNEPRSFGWCLRKRSGTSISIGLAQHLLAVVAEHALRLRVDHLDLAVGVDHDHGVGGGLDHLPEALFQALARGDVDDGRQHHRAFVGLDGIQADLDREFAAVLLQAVQVAAGAHRAGHGRGEEGAAQVRVVACGTARGPASRWTGRASPRARSRRPSRPAH